MNESESYTLFFEGRKENVGLHLMKNYYSAFAWCVGFCFLKNISRMNASANQLIYILLLIWIWNVNSHAVDGKEVGSIQSQLLCRAILDLYIGEDPFDKQAKEDIRQALTSILQK